MVARRPSQALVAVLAVLGALLVGLVPASATPAPPVTSSLAYSVPTEIDRAAPYAVTQDHPSAIACAAKTLCVVVDRVGQAVVSTTPTAGAAGNGAGTWHDLEIDPGHALTAVACPSVKLCVATDADGRVVVSTAPATAGSWSATDVDGTNRITGVSCSAVFCVAVDAVGNALSTSNPGGGSWSALNIGGSNPLTAVSCPSTSLCVAAASTGRMIVSTTPAVGPWTTLAVDSGRSLTSVSCATTTLCVGVDSDGVAVTSSAPTSTWTAVRVDGTRDLTSVGCTGAVCVAVDSTGTVLTSTSPTTAGSWTRAGLDDETDVVSVSCRSTTLCAAVDANGAVLISSNPAAGGRPWRTTPLAGGAADVACPSATLCVAVEATHVITTTDPTYVSSSWTTTSLASLTNLAGSFTSVACPATTLCVAVTDHGSIAESTNPTGGAAAWKVVAYGSDAYTDVTCAGTSLCVAAGSHGSGGGAVGAGEIAFTKNPTASSPTWSSTLFGSRSPAVYDVSAISCPSTSLCLAAEDDASALRSTAPTSGSWTEVDGAGTNDEGLSVSCPTTTFCVYGGQYGDTNRTTTSDESTTGTDSVRIDLPGDHVAQGDTYVACTAAAACLAAAGDAVGVTTTATRDVDWPGIEVDDATGAPVTFTGAPSCPATGLCVAATSTGVAVAEQPYDTTQGWSTATPADETDGVTSVSCLASGPCVAGDLTGRLLATYDLPGGVGWDDTVTPNTSPVRATACGSVLCYAVDADGTVLEGDPSSSYSAFYDLGHLSLATGATPTGLACTTADCLVTTTAGTVTAVDVNTGKAGTAVSLDPANGLSAIACQTSSACVVTDAAGDVFTTTSPTGAASAWTEKDVDGTHALTAVSCAPVAGTRSTCVAVDTAGDVVTTPTLTPATRGAVPVWTVSDADGSAVLRAVSCPSTALCEAVDTAGNAVTTTTPLAGASAWAVTPVVAGARLLDGVACPSAAACVAVDSAGDAITSRPLPSQVAFSSPARAVHPTKTASSRPITVQLESASGAPSYAPPGGQAVELTSSSGTGVFALTDGGKRVTSVTVPAGTSSTTVDYGDDTRGTSTISASVPAYGSDPGTQQVQVAGAAPPLFDTVQTSTGSSLEEVDGATGDVVRTIAGEGNGQVAVSPDGRFAYADDDAPQDDDPDLLGRLDKIDTSTGAVTEGPQIGASALALSPDGSALFVLGQTSDEYGSGPVLELVATSTMTVTQELSPPSSVISVAWDRSGRYVYLGELGNDDLQVFDTTTGATGQIAVPGDDPTGLALSPDGSTLWVSLDDQETLVGIDLTSRQVAVTIPLDGRPESVAASADGSHVYVGDETDQEVAVVDVATHAVASSFPVGDDPKDLALSPDGTHLAVGDGTEVDEYDPATGGVLPSPDDGSVAPPAWSPDPAPTASFTTKVSGKSVSFDGSASAATYGGIASYAWDFGDGTTATTTTPTTKHTYANGSWVARLTVTDAAGTSTTVVFDGRNVLRDGGPSATATQPVKVGKEQQTTTFTSTPSSPVVGTTYAPTATSSSGLPVTYAVSGSACTIAGATVTFTHHGTCTVIAQQSGDATWAAAPDAKQVIAVGKGTQAVTFTSTPPTGATVGGSYAPTATSGSGLAVTFTATGGCSLDDGVVTFTAAGSCEVDATQTGSTDWKAAKPVSQKVAVTS